MYYLQIPENEVGMDAEPLDVEDFSDSYLHVVVQIFCMYMGFITPDDDFQTEVSPMLETMVTVIILQPYGMPDGKI